MTSKSWLVTLTPLVIAILQFAKSMITGEDLTSQEMELIKYALGAFVTSGAVGAFISVKRK